MIQNITIKVMEKTLIFLANKNKKKKNTLTVSKIECIIEMITGGCSSVVECFLPKEEVASSSLVSRSKISRWTLVPSAYFVR